MNRREILRTLAAGSACGALAGGIVITATPSEAANDPCLAFVEGWEAASRACEAASTSEEAAAVYNERCMPFDRAAATGHILNATTAAGAAAAIRKALSFGDMEAQDETLIRAALAYLERGAA